MDCCKGCAPIVAQLRPSKVRFFLVVERMMRETIPFAFESIETIHSCIQFDDRFIHEWRTYIDLTPHIAIVAHSWPGLARIDANTRYTRRAFVREYLCVLLAARKDRCRRLVSADRADLPAIQMKCLRSLAKCVLVPNEWPYPHVNAFYTFSMAGTLASPNSGKAH